MQNLSLIVHIIFHPQSTLAVNLALYIVQQLNDDTNVPGLRITTQFSPLQQDFLPPNYPLTPRNGHFVVLLADDEMAADDDWCQFAANLWQTCQVNDHRCIPIQLTEDSWSLGGSLKKTSFFRAIGYKGNKEQKKNILRCLMTHLCRFMNNKSSDPNSVELPIKIFISHSKLDIDKNPTVVNSLIAFLNMTQPLKAWFDSGDITVGSEFAAAIEEGIVESSVLCVLTNNYSSREWCRKEILIAKLAQRPIVVIDTLTGKETRNFPYLGNVPAIRWHSNPEEIIDLLLKETLRILVVENRLSDVCKDTDRLLKSPPELLTLVNNADEKTNRGKINKLKDVLYPDPPLGNEEKSMLDNLNIQYSTPLERLSVSKKLNGTKIALSISQSTNIKKNGLCTLQQDQFAEDLSLYLLLKGVTMVYGGHLGKDGYVDKLFEMIRSHTDLLSVTKPAKRLDNYYGWPMPLTSMHRAKFKSNVQLIRVQRPDDVTEADHKDFTNEPKYFPADKSAIHRYAWARGMTSMREQQTQHIKARILVGGSFGPTTSITPMGEKKLKWYSGRTPGLLEEVLLSLKAGQPVFLIGAFGGMAEVIIDILEGKDRPEMSWAYQKDAPFAQEVRQLYMDKGVDWDDYPNMIADLTSKGIASVNPTLSIDENKTLFHSKDTNQIIELILKGLNNLS